MVLCITMALYHHHERSSPFLLTLHGDGSIVIR